MTTKYTFLPNHHVSTWERMMFEWERYISFKDFPMCCDLFPIVLAKGGFFYEGSNVICCCFCQQKSSVIKNKDNILLHSNGCEESYRRHQNVPIHNYYLGPSFELIKISTSQNRYEEKLPEATTRKTLKRQYDSVDKAYNQYRARRERYEQGNVKTTKHQNQEFIDVVPALPKVNSRYHHVVGGVCLSNTCCLDSILVIIYLYLYYNPDFRQALQSNGNKTYNLLLSVYRMYRSNKFGEALLAVVKYAKFQDIYIAENYVDLKGCDGNRFLCFLSDAVRIEVTLVSCTEKHCAQQSPSCSVPNIYITENLRGLPKDKIKDTIVDFVQAKISTLKQHMSGDCRGGHEFEQNIKYPLILPMNMCRGNIRASDLLQQSSFETRGNRYTLGGCTLHKNMHYTSLVKIGEEFGLYDNVHGRIQRLHSLPSDHIVSVAYYFKRLT